MLKPGSLLEGKYRILKIIGQGGMSVVYLAVNERANKHWAVKEFRKCGYQDFEVVRQNLIAEINILKKIRHPHLPRIIDVIDSGDSFLIVMDYIHGRTLEDILSISGAQPQSRVIKWARQLCDVLGYLHSQKPPIIYRDIKPGNIMIRSDGDVTLIDFGAARELKLSKAEDTTCLGTRGYAAPEQYGGHGQTDARTDIYCLGATLYHMLTGHNPAGPPYELYPIRYWNPALSVGLEQIILKCVRHNPEDRYQNCEELLYSLNHYERLEDGFYKEQLGRLKAFLVVFVLAAVFALTSILSGGYYHFLVRRGYQGYLEQAGQTQRLSELKAAIHHAVSLDRGNPQAYRLMLSWIISDNLLTDEEKTAMESLLYGKDGGEYNISYFRRHREEYDLFSYDLGLAYFFYYKGSRGKSIAKMWFDGLEDSSLSPEKKARAKIYSRIGSYYLSLANEDKTGERTEGNYTVFFHDLVTLNHYSPEQLGNPQAAVTLYCEIAGQLGAHAGFFLTKGKGITPLKMNREIQKIEEHMNNGSLRLAGKKELTKLLSNVNDAKSKIEAAAGQQERLKGDILSDKKQ